MMRNQNSAGTLSPAWLMSNQSMNQAPSPLRLHQSLKHWEKGVIQSLNLVEDPYAFFDEMHR